MKLKTTVVQEVEIDLMAIPAIDWPNEAKDIAYRILGQKYLSYRALPEHKRKAWLVEHIESWQRFDLNFL